MQDQKQHNKQYTKNQLVDKFSRLHNFVDLLRIMGWQTQNQ